MRFPRLILSLIAAPVLAVVPAALSAQIVVRDPCFYTRDDCLRRDDVARGARERALDRAADAEERTRRLADARQDRDLGIRVRDQLRADALADAREIRSRALLASQSRAREARERAELRAADRALERQQPARDRDRLRLSTRRVRWE
jgi:hypothetical protein